MTIESKDIEYIVGQSYCIELPTGLIYTGELVHHDVGGERITIRDEIDGALVSFELWRFGVDDIWYNGSSEDTTLSTVERDIETFIACPRGWEAV